MVTGTCVWVSLWISSLNMSRVIGADAGSVLLGDPRVCATRIQKAVESHSNVFRLDEKGLVEGGALGNRVRPVPVQGCHERQQTPGLSSH